MTQAQHTPGPWTLTADPLHFHSLTTVIGGKESGQKNGPPQQTIVQVGGFAEWKEAEANARLIAAAPELLEALQNMMDIVDDAPKGVARYYANGEDAPWSDFDREITAARAAIAKALGEPHR